MGIFKIQKAMMKIKLDVNGKFFVVTLAAGNHQTLQVSEAINTRNSVLKHIEAMKKAFGCKKIKVVDETGKFKEFA